MTKHVIINTGDKMTYQSLYRKYRPQHLSEVVGQKHILEVLENSLKKDMISHAYLFCGPRGTGKTSIAKLFAQSINCETQGAVACGMCSNCIEGKAGTHPDIIEIDAASNNGVDEIRGLIDRIKYTPILGKYKIYIIDEVHMLTAGAFNAFLKTLEEPPEHAVFVLATTEIHKVIPTIVSRCQRFDFNNISDPAIMGRLQYILDEERVDAEDGVTQVIASLSNGALRNALTILEQAIIVANPTITMEQVHELNGVVTARQKYSLLQSIMGDDMERLNNEIAQLLENSVDVERLIMDLVKTLKETVIFQYTKSDQHTSHSEKSLIAFIAPRVSTKVLLNMVETLLEYIERMKFSHSQEAYLQIALIRLFNQSNEGFIAPSAVNESPIIEDKPVSRENVVKLEHEKDIQPADIVLKPQTSEVTIDNSIDEPVHLPTYEEKPAVITHVEREYQDDIEEVTTPNFDPIETKNESFDPVASHIEPEVGMNFTKVNSDEPVEEELPIINKPVYKTEHELKIEVDPYASDDSSLDFETSDDPIVEDEVIHHDEIVEEEVQHEENIEEIVETVVEKPKETLLSIDDIIKYMVSANKDLRMIDEINYKKGEDFVNDFEWAKCARLLQGGDLVLSGNHFVMISLDQELEVKEILEPANNQELTKFSSMLFNNEKRIYACTRDDFSKAIARFRELAATSSLPKPLTDNDFLVQEQIKEVETNDIRLEKVKDLFGSKVNIIE